MISPFRPESSERRTLMNPVPPRVATPDDGVPLERSATKVPRLVAAG